jgi:hypothetical protein
MVSKNVQMGRQKRALVLLSQIALCHATLCCSCGVRVLVAGFDSLARLECGPAHERS